MITEKQEFRFKRISDNVKQMQTLMDDLLSLSRINQQDIVLKPINLETITTKLLSSLEKQHQHVDAEVTTQIAVTEAAGHETLIYQCLLYLVTNAINYRSSKRALRITIQTSIDDDKVGIHIIDNGSSIDKKDQHRIFTIFERLQDDKGTGVGLLLVKAATKKMNAMIEVDSELDNGSRFSIFLGTSNY